LAQCRGRVLPVPSGEFSSPFEALRRAADFFADLSAVERRRHGTSEVCRLTEIPDGGYPPYYLQKFHFQTDGYLSGPRHNATIIRWRCCSRGCGRHAAPSAGAAQSSSHPTRGGAAARRRLRHWGFLRQVKANHPRLQVIGLDLSPYYLAVARRKLQPGHALGSSRNGGGDAVGDEEFDTVTCIYLFHELPPRCAAPLSPRSAACSGGVAC